MDFEKLSAEIRRTTLSWDTVLEATTIYPEYEDNSLGIIERFLDYLPDQAIYTPHQLFVKTCLASYNRGELSEDDLIQELEFHCKRIRNDDMKKYGWADSRKYDQSDYDLYETHLGIYKEKARKRLCKLIVWEDAPLDYTLGAELFLRQLFLDDNYHDDQRYGLFESRAVTIASYRQALLEKGPEAANDSLLYGQHICKTLGISPITLKELL